jgi:hypothetical protein
VRRCCCPIQSLYRSLQSPELRVYIPHSKLQEPSRAGEFSLSFGFYKKGCQEKKILRELETAKSFGIQPLCCCAGASRRSGACVVWPGRGEM